MKKYVFDSESDGLLLEATRLWIICVKDYHTGERWKYMEGDDGWKEKLEEATHLIGHNIVGHDFPLFKKLTGWEPKKDQIIQDTVIMSRALDYNRHVNNKHGMEEWGIQLGQRKQEHENWHEFSPEMVTRCESDVDLNCEIYKIVLGEFQRKAPKNPKLGLYLLAEQAAAKWCAMSQVNGWPFDKPTAIKIASQLEEVIETSATRLQPLLGYKAVAKDKVKNEIEIKRAKWTMDGAYNHHIANWFGINPWSGLEGEERSVVGEFCRLEVKELKLSSTTDVKIFLFRNGWVPFEYNSKYDPKLRKKVVTSPKITEDSLEFLGGDGKLYRDYAVASSRHSILKTWIESVDDEGNLHGDCMCIGTPSMRATHKIIVNVPSMDSAWGPEMRALFVCKPGYKLIGCDSSGNQGRGLAYYINNPEYTHIMLNEDIHIYNAQALDKVIKGMGIDWTEHFAKNVLRYKRHLKRFLEKKGISSYDYFMSGRPYVEKVLWKSKRGRSKRIYYAFLFGAGGPKLWGYAFSSPDAELGQKLKAGFIRSVPGFENLIKKLEAHLKATKKKYGPRKGFILSLAGNRIYVDAAYKVLVYLLQSFEKITVAAAIMVLMEYFEDEGIEYHPHIFMHDEIDFSVPEHQVERAKELARLAFQEGGKLFGVDIMDGGSKSGMNWKDIH